MSYLGSKPYREVCMILPMTVLKVLLHYPDSGHCGYALSIYMRSKSLICLSCRA